MTEKCNECGESVAQGSGKFVNRVPDFNTTEERGEMGKPHPEGEFMCAECDGKIREDKGTPEKTLAVKMKMFKVAEDEKCGGCNWKVHNLYLMGNTKEDAMRAYVENDRGLCGDCMGELLVDGGYEISNLVRANR